MYIINDIEDACNDNHKSRLAADTEDRVLVTAIKAPERKMFERFFALFQKSDINS